ncbi:MAG: UDP-N-acetylmuramoyl-L-alanyl-D-glutamate--2,6-diaminopimelate ligase [Kordiimonadaceae bacterium]|nr:UDP-N-acetylmuramoyl-L-alanyl-D-glutamate--2,6-diaminopimelate ligase [Kordiimonadaceae bacterium]MBO6569148.1 UDP-N-acetylmuramoyl-L-alanyl-D-glutamate--2,6-diaminopimelate ligase [Kordiimonadaceae bacterium]MBO6964624.1 UDP-N-acetylmuramoyl-L-alanyl-D-glutamate--2,6-diaminopimelate ligase [Kordiimonadaceae bacterium]
MTARLLELLGGSGASADVVISGVTNDSRAVSPGNLFAALPGSVVDGKDFVGSALEKGAAAILMERSPQAASISVPVIQDHNPRKRYAEIAANFAGPQPDIQVAVTGTNGKTSVADFTRQIWEAVGKSAASIGTLGVRSQAINLPGGLTTPDPVELHQVLSKLKSNQIDRVAVEASSHGLDQYRLDGMALKAAAFTNLSRDHLDYHKTEPAYFYAKARLFGELLSPGSLAVINMDCPRGRTLDDIAWGRSLERLTYGFTEAADLQIVSATPNAIGQVLELKIHGELRKVSLPLVGSFQAMNVLAAAGLVSVDDVELGEAVSAFETLEGVPGRLELIGQKNGAGLYVDYAHTPDGLKTVLMAARAHKPNKLHVVFGCGGDRDTGKRPLMGQVAAELADLVYVTDDNPRTENAAAIRAEIMEGCPGATEIGDRASAIEAAAGAAAPGDMIIVAGKGHETGQILADNTIEYSDIETVRAITGSGSLSAAGKG